MALTILAAIKDRWYGQLALTSLITGGLYVNEVPENLNGQTLSFPYTYIEHPSSDFSYTMSTEYFEVGQVDFCTFAVGAAAAEACLLAIRTAFDWQTLAFEDASQSTYLRPLRTSLMAEPVRNRDGSLLYRAHISYEIFISRLTPPG